jgi:hypothetical protein
MLFVVAAAAVGAGYLSKTLQETRERREAFLWVQSHPGGFFAKTLSANGIRGYLGDQQFIHLKVAHCIDDRTFCQIAELFPEAVVERFSPAYEEALAAEYRDFDPHCHDDSMPASLRRP